MRSIRIDGRRVHCLACKSRFAVISIDGFAVCSKCLKAFFVGLKVGGDRSLKGLQVEIMMRNASVTLTRKPEVYS